MLRVDCGAKMQFGVNSWWYEKHLSCRSGEQPADTLCVQTRLMQDSGELRLEKWLSSLLLLYPWLIALILKTIPGPQYRWDLAAHKVHYVGCIEGSTMQNFKIHLPAKRFALPVVVVAFFSANKKKNKQVLTGSGKEPGQMNTVLMKRCEHLQRCC